MDLIKNNIMKAIHEDAQLLVNQQHKLRGQVRRNSGKVQFVSRFQGKIFSVFKVANARMRKK